MITSTLTALPQATTTSVVDLDLTEAPVTEHADGHGTFTPTHATVTFTFDGVDWRPSDVQFTGPLTRDGKPSCRQGRRGWHDYGTGILQQVPNWVGIVIAQAYVTLPGVAG